MLPSSTVFVIGAGAGCDIGMPIGSELARDIAGRVNLKAAGFGQSRQGDAKLWAAIHAEAQTRANAGVSGHIIEDLRKAAVRIHAGIHTADSIDDFVDRARHWPEGNDVELCAKVAIARSILHYEGSKSSLKVDRSNVFNTMDLTRIGQTWLMKLLRLLLRQHDDPSRLFENVAFINFNYDRCLEYFFLHALQPAHRMTESDAAALVRESRIYHPYGTVGTLPQLATPGSIAVEFGEEERADLLSISSQIRTYTEQIDDQAYVDRIRAEVASARTIVFLGFAYHRQNMVLITPEVHENSAKSFYGTAFGFSDSDRRIIMNYVCALVAEPYRAIVTRHGSASIRSDLTCDKLFDEYGRTLAGA